MTITRLTWIAAIVALAVIAAMFVALNCDPLAAILGIPMSTYRAPVPEKSWEEDTVHGYRTQPRSRPGSVRMVRGNSRA